jgi:type I restriction enzyme S subunit
MKENKNIPVGYKDSAIGIIPEEWEIKKLIEVCQNFKSGEGITSQNISIEDKYPVYGGNGLRGYTNKFTHDGEYILIGRQGALCGNILYIKGKAYISEHAIAASTNEYANIKWLGYKLDFLNLNRLSESSAQPGLAVNKLEKIKISIPLFSEQKKITEILSTWDDAIEVKSKLVDKLKLRKQALMQQLLTGKKRLKGFDKEWRTISIRDIAKEVSIRNKNNEQIIVLSCTKYKGLVPSLEYFGKRIFAEDLSAYKIVPKGHFAYATNHIEEGSIGYQNLYEKGLISPMYTVFKTDSSINDKFFFSLLKSHKLIHYYNSRMEGSIDRRGGLRWESFSGIKINIPSNEEQTAIANILSTSDKEIEIANTKLDKLREQKKGLMQQLLTGKKRVKLN